MYYEDNRLCTLDHVENEYTISGGPAVYGTITFAQMDEFNARIGWQFTISARNSKPSMSWWQDSLGVKLKRGLRL